MIDGFQTDRLRAVALKRSHTALLLELNSDPQVMRYLTGAPSSLAEVQDELEESLGTRWLVTDASDQFLGWARSRAVMERIGLTYARTFHLDFVDPLPGTELGEVEYDLLVEDWESHRV